MERLPLTACLLAASLAAPVPLLVAPVGGAGPAAPGRAGLATVRVTVVDRDGKPVAGLGKDDFALTIDGQPRRVESVRFVSHVPAPPSAEPAARAGSDDEGAWTPPGRLMVLAVDQAHIRRGGTRAVLATASAFMERLGPADRVALVTLPGGEVKVPPTTDRVRIRGGLDVTAGLAQPARSTRDLALADALALEDRDFSRWEAVLARECDDRLEDESLRAQCRQSLDQAGREIAATVSQASAGTLRGLERVLAWTAESPGPKTIVLFTEGLVTGTARSPEAIASARRLAAPAAAAGASFYVFHLQGRLFDVAGGGASSGALEDEALGRNGLQVLAAHLRGAVFPVSSPADEALRRVSAETSAYYLLELEPRGQDRRGARRIDVQARQPGVVVQWHGDLAAPIDPAGLGVEQRLLDALRSPVPARETPVALASRVIGLRDRAVRVSVTARIGRDVKAPGEVSTGFLVLDEHGGIAANGVDTRTLQVAGSGGPAQLQYAAAFDVAPGSYVLKFAAVDPEGRLGVAERAFTVTGQEEPVAGPDAAGAAPGAERAPLPDSLPALDRATAYVDQYVEALSRIVCEERYEQQVQRPSVGQPLTGALETVRREIVSDLVFVRLPGAGEWSTFRDVYSVDGKPVRDREDRLLALFVKPRVDRWQQLERIREESSRHNIGGITRDINIPTFALQFLLSGVQAHFAFEPVGSEKVSGVETQVLAFRETARPTVIRGRHDEDVPAFGQVWVDPAQGTVVRTRLETRSGDGRSRIDVSFQRSDRLAMWLPATMEERHTVPGEEMRGRAAYSNFRQFKVETSEEVK